MTIDEAIEKFKFIANSDTPCPRYCMLPCDKCVDESKQLAQWLEELVMLRLDSCMIHMPERLHLVENGYNKALNDFVNVCEKQFTTMYGQRYVDMRDIVNIAEQLKVGVTND